MKKHFFLFLLLSGFTISVRAQDLWGTALNTAPYQGGTLFSYNISSGQKTTRYIFGSVTEGHTPRGSLIQASDGNLYGLSSRGGTLDAGTLFRYDINSGMEKNLYNFGAYPGGQNPVGSLIQANNGLLYGVTNTGNGSGDYGAIFSFDIVSGAESNLYVFNNFNTGLIPGGSLIQARNGILYGMTSAGGNNTFGTIFQYDISAGEETKLYNFGSGTDGKVPDGSLLQGTNGLLYGTTSKGGIHGSGTIFSFDISARTEKDLYDFKNVKSDGKFPMGALIRVNDSLVFGMTSAGGANDSGVIYSFNLVTGKETVIHSFGPDGRCSFGSLLRASDGSLYGMTETGGAKNAGTIFRYNLFNGKISYPHNFGISNDGRNPSGSLFQANNGMLYALTSSGGLYNWGTVISYDISGKTETDLHDFGAGTSATMPYGSLIHAKDGLLYGLSWRGGGYNAGTIFSYDISAGKETELFAFGKGTHYANPFGSLIQARNGLLYGMTFNDGAFYKGTIFSYDITRGKENVLHVFGSDTDAQYPLFASLFQAGNGILYGITESGGSKGGGVIFSYDIKSATEKVLHSFTLISDTSDGSAPVGTLIQASNGLLYGITESGGKYGYGTLFSFNVATNKETKLHDFGNGNDGQYPLSALLQAKDGFLYGVTESYDDYNGGGTLFRFDIATNSEIVLHDFQNFDDGTGPMGSLMQAANGELYGTTIGGGTSGFGSIYSYNISAGTDSVLSSFQPDSNGYSPFCHLIEADIPSLKSIQRPISDMPLAIFPNPASNVLHIRIGQNWKESCTLSLYNIAGQLVWSKDLRSGVEDIPINNLANGVYVLKVFDGSSSEQRKVVISR